MEKDHHYSGPRIMNSPKADTVVVGTENLSQAQGKIHATRRQTIARRIAWTVVAVLFATLIWMIIPSWDGINRSNFARITKGVTTEEEVEAMWGKPTGGHKSLNLKWWCGRKAEALLRVEEGRVTYASYLEFYREPGLLEKIRKFFGL